MMQDKKRSAWSGQLAFILATAGSAIGLGNLWRFPYLAAQYGGGMFIAIYIALVVTLGFSLMVTEIAIGRYTRQSALTAFGKLNLRWRFVGTLMTLSALFIISTYVVICGWVIYYFKSYAVMAFSGVSLMGENGVLANVYFNNFISNPIAPFAYAFVFLIVCASINAIGIKNGIEKANFILMPLLFFIAIALAIYVVCLPGTADGLKYYLVPNLSSLQDANGAFSPARLAKMVLGALGQMFYSLSLVSAILVPYGSYMSRKDSIERSVRRVEICDTCIALIAGLIIIPVVYLFATKTGTPIQEAMNAGPGLMFITLPRVFATFGSAGAWIGFTFFLLVIFAGATSAIALLEGVVSSICDAFHMSRKKSALLSVCLVMLLMPFIAMSYGPFANVKIFKMAILDFCDFITGAGLLPLTAFFMALFVGWIMKPHRIIGECRLHKNEFRSWRFYFFVVRYIAPFLILALFISEICRALGIGGWSI